MKRLKLIPNSNRDRSFEELLADMFIDPLENELGFKFIGYNSLGQKNGNGVHVLMLQEPNKLDLEGPEYERLIEICTQDDDGQPHANFRFYCGSLWVMIPFVS